MAGSGAIRMNSWIPAEIRWLFREVRPFFHWHLASFLCISLGSILSLLVPLVLKWLIDIVLPGHNVGLLILAVVMIFICHHGMSVFGSIGNYVTVLTVQRFAVDLRHRLIRQLDRLSPAYHENNPVGVLMYPLREPVDEIATFGSDLVPSMLRMLMLTTLTLSAMLFLNHGLTLAVAPLLPAFLLARQHYRRQLERNSEQLQDNQIAWINFLQEHLSRIIAIQILRKEHRQEREAFRLLGRKARALKTLFRTGISFSFFTSLTTALAIAAVLGYGSWKVVSGSMTIGGLIAFYTYLVQLFEPLSGVAELYVRMQKTIGSIRKVQEVFMQQPEITNYPNAILFSSKISWPIELSNVEFRYPGGRGILAINKLHIPSGQMLAVAGANGAGKSTLVKLLARFYDVHAGCISIANHDVREFKIESLREHVCYVPPQPALFDTTIAGNLRICKTTASESDIWEALEVVGLVPWAESLEQGVYHKVGPEGMHLSRGQAQALALARTILVAPQVLILDEATASIDITSEQQILRRLRQRLCGSTIIVISHRLSTISTIERTVCLRNGRLVSEATSSSIEKAPYSFTGSLDIDFVPEN